MATHSSILAWKIPWTEEPSGLLVHGVGRKESDATKCRHTHLSIKHALNLSLST